MIGPVIATPALVMVWVFLPLKESALALLYTVPEPFLKSP